MNKNPSSTSANTELAQNARRTANIFLIAGSTSMPIYAYAAYQTGAWQMYGLMATVFLFVISSIASIFSIRRGNLRLGTNLILGGLLIVIPMLSVFVAGLGLTLGVVDIILIAAIAGQILTPQQTPRVIGLGVISGILSIAIDLFQLTPSLEVPIISTYIPIIAGVLITIYAYFFVRQFRDYSLSAKLVSSFLLVSIIPLAGLAIYNNNTGRQTLTDEANARLSTSAANTAAALDGFITDGLNDIRTTAQLHILKEYLALPAGERAGSETELVLIADLRAPSLAVTQPSSLQWLCLISVAAM